MSYRDRKRSRDRDDFSSDKRPRFQQRPSNYEHRQNNRAFNSQNNREDFSRSSDNYNQRKQSFDRSQNSNEIRETVVSKPEIREELKKPENLNRNKRLFGSLIGHLGSARQLLEKDSVVIRKQHDMQNFVREKVQKEAERIKETKQFEKAKQILDSATQAIKTATENWKNRIESLSSLIPTKCNPPIFWLPANMNNVTKELLEERRKHVNHLIQEREDRDKLKLQSLEEKYQYRISKINAHLNSNSGNNNLQEEVHDQEDFVDNENIDADHPEADPLDLIDQLPEDKLEPEVTEETETKVIEHETQEQKIENKIEETIEEQTEDIQLDNIDTTSLNNIDVNKNSEDDLKNE